MTPELGRLSVRDTAAAMRSWRLHAEATEDGPEPPERPSELYLAQTLDGQGEVSGHGNRHHHHLWHSEYWELRRQPDATLELRSPSGLTFTSRPRPAQSVFS